MQPAHVERSVGIEKTVVRPEGKAPEAEIAVQWPLGRIRLGRVTQWEVFMAESPARVLDAALGLMQGVRDTTC